MGRINKLEGLRESRRHRYGERGPSVHAATAVVVVVGADILNAKSRARTVKLRDISRDHHSLSRYLFSSNQAVAIMSITRHISKVMERIAPLTLAEKWDNVRPSVIR